jgi:FkbM family methyltransferase
MSHELYGLLLNGLFSGFLDDISCKDKVVIVKGFAIPFRELSISEVIFDSLRFGWRYNISHSYWFRNNLKFRHMRNYILEVFDYKEYDHLNVENRYVVDIGAGYGETAIYFILGGAKHVIAIEPCPDVFNELLENLRLNNIMDKVSPINKAIASVHDRINIECPSGNFVVDTVSLRDVMKNNDLDDAVLKMDCEGCEYDVILSEYKYVRQFNELYFEYHAYITKNL